MVERRRIKQMMGKGWLKVWREGILLGCFDCFDADTDSTDRTKDAQGNDVLDLKGDAVQERNV